MQLLHGRYSKYCFVFQRKDLIRSIGIDYSYGYLVINKLKIVLFLTIIINRYLHIFSHSKVQNVIQIVNYNVMFK